MSGRLTARPQRSQHRHDGCDATAGSDEQECFRGRVRQREVAFGRLQANDGARFDAVDQVGGQEALGGGFHGDRDVLVAAFGNRRQRIRPPVPFAVDAQTDADVLTRAVVAGESPARPDDDGCRVFGLGFDRHDLAAQFARRPQRVEQRQVVVGEQRCRRSRGQAANRVHPRPRGGVHVFRRGSGPAHQSFQVRSHESPLVARQCAAVTVITRWLPYSRVSKPKRGRNRLNATA